MAEVTVKVNGRAYAVGCEDGQEEHVMGLAAIFDQHVSQVAEDVGQLGDTRLFLLGALLLADELAETQGSLSGVSGDLNRLRVEHLRIEGRAVAALEAAANTIEALAVKSS